MILFLASIALFAYPVVPVEAAIPTPIEVVAVVDERRIKYARSAPIHERTRTTTDKPRCVGHWSG